MEVLFDRGGLEILSKTATGVGDEPRWFLLRQEAEKASLQPGFDRLISLEKLPDLHLFEHQRKAVFQVLRQMRGRALLADEVGLGKTIEAGVILREYMARGLIERVLILTPAALVNQWKDELASKLQLSFTVNRERDQWQQQPHIIASLDTAKREEHAARIHAVPWDLVIVDEAHRLKNRSTLNWKFVNKIQKTYLLLLTATPIQNDLQELYNLITLLQPGQLQTYSQFKRSFMINKRSPKNVLKLRQQLQRVMIRTTRQETGLKFPRRLATTVMVQLSSPERRAYNMLLEALRRAYQRLPKRERNILPMVVLLRELCSSPQAARGTLDYLLTHRQHRYLSRRDLQAIRQQLEGLVGAKLKQLTAFLQNTREKVLVFTEFRPSQEGIAKMLSSCGLSVATYHGGLSASAKDEAISQFRRSSQVLVSTEAGGEGRNLQFCRTVINFDLPWNPMRLEQRIGRVHRLGQTRDVHIVNMALTDTVEVHILYLLEQKIRMFEEVIGELDLIITGAGNQSLETALAQALLSSRNEEELRKKVEALGQQLASFRKSYDEIKQLNAAVLDENDTVSMLPTAARER